MVNSYITSGNIAPQIIFYNGPASSGYTSSRYSLYPVNATPTFKIDGLNTQVGWSQANCENYIDARIATPSVIDIDVNYVGDENGGLAYYAITAESDPGITNLKVWAAILEDHDVGTSSYGVYNNQELMWEPRDYPLGTSGTAIEFSGSYPETIHLMGSYTLNPAEHSFGNLNGIVYVQTSSGTKEVLNACFEDLPDTAAGTADESFAAVNEAVVLGAWPNPSYGAFSVASQLPQGATGTVEIFNVSGRLVDSFSAGSIEPVEMEEPGVYLIRMTTSSGEIRNSQVAVVR